MQHASIHPMVSYHFIYLANAYALNKRHHHPEMRPLPLSQHHPLSFLHFSGTLGTSGLPSLSCTYALLLTPPPLLP